MLTLVLINNFFISMKSCIFIAWSLIAIALITVVGCEDGGPLKDAEASPIWTNCGTSSDMSTIKNVTIIPSPPQRGKPLTIDAWFTLKENITGGSFTASIKYGFLPTLKQTIEVCKLATLAGLKCPVSKETNHIHITQDVPSVTPGGHYKGQVIGVDQNGKRIGCINIDAHI